MRCIYIKKTEREIGTPLKNAGLNETQIPTEGTMGIAMAFTEGLLSPENLDAGLSAFVL